MIIFVATCHEIHRQRTTVLPPYYARYKLFQQQARERDAGKREILLHRIQQLTIDRVMFAPIWSTRVLIGVGPRVADHTINLVPMSIWPSYEDMKLKNQ